MYWSLKIGNGSWYSVDYSKKKKLKSPLFPFDNKNILVYFQTAIIPVLNCACIKVSSTLL